MEKETWKDEEEKSEDHKKATCLAAEDQSVGGVLKAPGRQTTKIRLVKASRPRLKGAPENPEWIFEETGGTGFLRKKIQNLSLRWKFLSDKIPYHENPEWIFEE